MGQTRRSSSVARVDAALEHDQHDEMMTMHGNGAHRITIQRAHAIMDDATDLLTHSGIQRPNSFAV